MAASTTQNPTVRSESKSAKKKKTKAAEGTSGETVATEVTQSSNPESASGEYESPYIKELYKSIRNVNKKITNASKVDNILAENPGKSLDELVASRKINKDQQAQILKIPSLKASLSQLEEQISQYKKFDQEYKAKSQAEKAEFEKSFTERSGKELEDAVASAKADVKASAVKEQQDNLLLVSQFLRLAAIRRLEVERADEDLSKALEGLLATVYGGTTKAVTSIVNLIEGSSDLVKNVEEEDTTVTFAEIKEETIAKAQELVEGEYKDEAIERLIDEASAESTEYPTQSDPTIANAGLTELDAPPSTAAVTNGAESFDAQGVPQNSGFGDGAANAAAEANWDNNNDLSASQEWVEVPRDAAETDTGITATPAAPANTQSWADDQPESPQEKSTPAPNPNDGFHEVQRNRGGQQRGGQGQGQYRGRGRGGGENRGRGGFRGDGYRGRGRGGGGNRGGPRPEQS